MKPLKLLSLLAFSISLSACGFHLRSAKELPPQLHELCLKTSAPYTSLIARLTNMLTALDLKIDKECKQAPYILNINNLELTHDNPAIADANQAVTFNYALHVNMSLQNKQGVAIIPDRNLVASRAVILNSQQIYTPYNTDSVEKQLEQIILNQIFDQLTTQQAKNSFATYSR